MKKRTPRLIFLSGIGKIFIVIVISVPLILSGCIKVKKTESVTAGIYKSVNKGDSWEAKRILVGSGGIGSIANANILKMFFDPQDNNALYLATENMGLIYTYDGGTNWLQPLQINSGQVYDVAVDPVDKCNIYVSAGNKISKSTDCNRSWKEIYFERERKSLTINSLAIDYQNSQVIYAGNSFGEIIKSYNGGLSWTTINRFNNSIVEILIDKDDSKVIYVALSTKGIYKSFDQGGSWIDINNDLKKYSGATRVIDIFPNPSVTNSLFILSQYGILKTDNGGDNWQVINLITPPLQTKIYSVTVNPQNDKEIVYGTASALYKTVNGGENWTVKRLPTAGIANTLLIDPINPNIIYMGIRVIKQ